MNLHWSSFFYQNYTPTKIKMAKKKKIAKKCYLLLIGIKKDTGLCYKVSLKLIASTTLRLLYRPLLRHYKA